MEPVTSQALKNFFERLGKAFPGSGKFYLLGGSALCLLGSPRATLDIDYTFTLEGADPKSFEALVEQLANELRLDLESVPLAEFLPLPSDAYQRRRFIGRYGNLDVYLFDLYSIALSKIARGFETDLDDVVFMLREELINLAELERLFQEVTPAVGKFDINPKEFTQYFAEVKKRVNRK